jgi:predicted amidohydrolase
MIAPTSPHERVSTRCLRLAILHLAAVPGDLVHNRQLVETAVTKAAELGADWIVTPELCVCGYAFANRIGTDWIEPQPDAWMSTLCRHTAELGVTVFLACPERDAESANLYNSVFVISAHLTCSKHEKLNRKERRERREKQPQQE